MLFRSTSQAILQTASKMVNDPRFQVRVRWRPGTVVIWDNWATQHFAVGDYFRERGIKTADPSFIDDVPVRFVVSDPSRHYHVPIIASPWTYSTYRGGMPPKGE